LIRNFYSPQNASHHPDLSNMELGSVFIQRRPVLRTNYVQSTDNTLGVTRFRECYPEYSIAHSIQQLVIRAFEWSSNTHSKFIGRLDIDACVHYDISRTYTSSRSINNRQLQKIQHNDFGISAIDSSIICIVTYICNMLLCLLWIPTSQPHFLHATSTHILLLLPTDSNKTDSHTCTS